MSLLDRKALFAGDGQAGKENLLARVQPRPRLAEPVEIVVGVASVYLVAVPRCDDRLQRQPAPHRQTRGDTYEQWHPVEACHEPLHGALVVGVWPPVVGVLGLPYQLLAQERLTRRRIERLEH